MKKLIKLIFICLITMLLVSCGGNDNNDKNDQTNNSNNNNNISSDVEKKEDNSEISTVKVYSFDEAKDMLDEIELTADNFMNYFDWKGEFSYEDVDGLSGKNKICTSKYMSIMDGYVAPSMYYEGISPEITYNKTYNYKSVSAGEVFTDSGTTKGNISEFVYCPVPLNSVEFDSPFPLEGLAFEMISNVTDNETVTIDITNFTITNAKGSIFKSKIANDKWNNNESGQYIDLSLNRPESLDSENYYRLFKNGSVYYYSNGMLQSQFQFRNIDCALLEYVLAQGHIEEWLTY